MMIPKSAFKFIILILCMIALIGCSSPTTTVLEAVEEPEQPTPADSTNNKTEIIASKPTSTSSGNSEPTLTVTPSKTILPTSSPTSGDIIPLDWCSFSEEDVCIGSVSLNYGTLAMVVVMPDNQEDIYLLIEKEKYENCVPIASFDDRFLCINLPKLINKTVFIQIFKEGVEAPLAEGEIFLDQALIGSMQPTDTPQPPDPYAP